MVCNEEESSIENRELLEEFIGAKKMIQESRTYGAYELLLLSEIVDVPDALGTEWVFRGQADEAWEISSSLERGIDRLYIPNRPSWLDNDVGSEFESTTLEKIKSAPPIGAHIDWAVKDDFSWLALLQHHGCKTRIVDFTESFRIAVHFAVRDLPAQDAAVWAIRTSALDEKMAFLLAKYGDKFSKEGIGRRLVENSITWRDRYRDNGNLAVVYGKPQHPNQRMIAQHGLFLCPLNLDQRFMENLNRGLDLAMKNEPVKKLRSLDELKEAAKEEKVVKIVIPKSGHAKLLHLFRGMNISDATLFPGIDGFARSLNYYLR